jgi:hypothetical protein
MNNNLKNILIITARADFGGGPEHVYRLLKLLHKDVNFFVACPKDYPYWERYSDIIGREKPFANPAP